MCMKKFNETNLSRRKLLGLMAVGGAGAVAVPEQWSKPLVRSVLLPAHAQTSTVCLTDNTIGGPLLGNPSGASSCQAACEDLAASNSAQLCAVRESLNSSNATICECDLDLP